MKVLEVAASGRHENSVSRQLARELVDALADRHGEIDHVRRDLADGIPFVDDRWIDANFTAPDERSPAQREALAASDALVDEVERADILVIGAPIYNFGIPAALKAWVDMIARARRTFRYTPDGPKGLLEGKTAYIIVASGGVAVDSRVDFATPYLRHALRFVGIDDIEVIAAERLNLNYDDALDAARERIAAVVFTEPVADSRAA